MRKLVFVAAFLCLGFQVISQKSKPTSSEIKIPMTQDRWEFKPNSVEFITHKNMPAIKLLNSGDKLIPKGIEFTNGTIEYDVETHEDETFVGIFFHLQNDEETEFFYLRPQNSAKHVMTAVQYAGFIKGVNLWDLLPHYQGPAEMKKGEWNHIKLVVSGMQMLVYVNSSNVPTLEIPRLEGNTQTGRIAFNGRSVISNLVIKPDMVEGLPAREGFDPTHHDSRYIRAWQMTEPKEFPRGRELFEMDFPKLTTKWQTINVERRGLVNLTRLYGSNRDRKYIWLRTKLISATEQRKKIAFGFSDEVWVFLNRQPVFVDKNIFFAPGMQREPRGRISVENAQFEIPLQKGENELLVGIANDFYGWGIIARLNNMEGMDFNIDFPAPIDPPKDLNVYAGSYKTEGAQVKLLFKVENDMLIGQANDQPPIPLEYFEKDKFRYESAGVIVEFKLDEKKLILIEGKNSTVFTKD